MSLTLIYRGGGSGGGRGGYQSLDLDSEIFWSNLNWGGGGIKLPFYRHTYAIQTRLVAICLSKIATKNLGKKAKSTIKVTLYEPPINRYVAQTGTNDKVIFFSTIPQLSPTLSHAKYWDTKGIRHNVLLVSQGTLYPLQEHTVKNTGDFNVLNFSYGVITLAVSVTGTGTGTGIRTMGDNRSRLQCNVKASTLFHTTHFPSACSSPGSSQCNYTITLELKGSQMDTSHCTPLLACSDASINISSPHWPFQKILIMWFCYSQLFTVIQLIYIQTRIIFHKLFIAPQR